MESKRVFSVAHMFFDFSTRLFGGFMMQFDDLLPKPGTFFTPWKLTAGQLKMMDFSQVRFILFFGNGVHFQVNQMLHSGNLT